MIQQYHKRSLDKCQSLAHCSSWPDSIGCQASYPVALIPHPCLLLKQKCRHLLEGLPSTLFLSVTGKKACPRVPRSESTMQPGIIILQPETGKAGHYPEVSPRMVDGTGSYGRKPQETVTALFITATCPHWGSLGSQHLKWEPQPQGPR